jgi:signal transduction histidine kinase
VDRTGLHGALETLALGVPHHFEIPCTFECERPPPELDSTVEEHLYRIAQEATNNALTHGRPSRIEISLSSHGRRGLLSVRDDGVGMSEEAHRSDGLGMQTMRYRSHLIGGTLEVRRRSNQGTVVACAFPLRSSSDPG